MTLTAWFMVILITSAAVLLGFGWLLGRGQGELERVTLLAELDQATANVQLPQAGYLYMTGPPFAGASLTGQPDPMAAFDAGYELGQRRAAQDEVSREVDAIMAEIEADPRWQK